VRADDVTTTRGRGVIALVVVGAITLMAGVVLVGMGVLVRIGTRHPFATLTPIGVVLFISGLVFGAVVLSLYAIGRAVAARRSDGQEHSLRPEFDRSDSDRRYGYDAQGPRRPPRTPDLPPDAGPPRDRQFAGRDPHAGYPDPSQGYGQHPDYPGGPGAGERRDHEGRLSAAPYHSPQVYRSSREYPGPQGYAAPQRYPEHQSYSEPPAYREPPGYPDPRLEPRGYSVPQGYPERPGEPGGYPRQDDYLAGQDFGPPPDYLPPPGYQDYPASREPARPGERPGYGPAGGYDDWAVRPRGPEPYSEVPPGLRDPGPRLRGPDPRLRDPEAGPRDPEPRLRDPEARPRDPEPRLGEPEPYLRDPEPWPHDHEMGSHGPDLYHGDPEPYRSDRAAWNFGPAPRPGSRHAGPEYLPDPGRRPGSASRHANPAPWPDPLPPRHVGQAQRQADSELPRSEPEPSHSDPASRRTEPVPALPESCAVDVVDSSARPHAGPSSSQHRAEPIDPTGVYSPERPVPESRPRRPERPADIPPAVEPSHFSRQPPPGQAHGPGPLYGPAPAQGFGSDHGPGGPAHGPVRGPGPAYSAGTGPEPMHGPGYGAGPRAADGPGDRYGNGPGDGTGSGSEQPSVFVYRDGGGAPVVPPTQPPAAETEPARPRGPFEPMARSAAPPPGPDTSPPPAQPGQAVQAREQGTSADDEQSAVHALDQIKDLYATAEAIGDENVDRHFDELLQRQRELISEFFKESRAKPGDTTATTVSPE
jgi:hypothetical protein